MDWIDLTQDRVSGEAYTVLVGKPEGKRPLGGPRLRFEDNIKMDLREVGCGGYGLDRSDSGDGEWRGVYRVLVGKPEGKRPLGGPRLRFEDNIKMDLRYVGCGGYGLDIAGSGYGQVAGVCEWGNEPSAYIKCEELLD
jgi:hypothetical protein